MAKGFSKILGIVILLMGALLIEMKARPIQRAYDNWVMDNVHHYVSCENLPTLVEVTKVLERKQALVQKIEAVNPGFTHVSIRAECPQNASILIEYPGHQNRLEIEAIVANENFDNVPYTLINY